MNSFTILTINPGSTSTKIAVFENENLIFEESLSHSSDQLEVFETVAKQFAFRKKAILNTLLEKGFDIDKLDVIVGRGGLLFPMESGVYEVNELMKNDLLEAKNGEHASNLGGLIAEDLATEIGHGVKAYIADPVVVDELSEVARVSGHPLFSRTSIFHALNQKAIGRAYAKSVNKKYEDLNLIIAHMGGGISIGAHQKGKVVDVNNALDGEGPFTPERSGTLPAGQLVNACFSGSYTKNEVKEMIKGHGGLVAHLGTNDVRTAIVKYKAGDEHTILIINAMCYGVSKSIGAMAAALKGDVDAIIITGGIANNRETLMSQIIEHVKFIAPVEIFPGEDEMLALAMNGLRVVSGETLPMKYSGKVK